MTDKMTDNMIENEQQTTNQAQTGINEECNDNFMSFLVYSFMKNM